MSSSSSSDDDFLAASAEETIPATAFAAAEEEIIPAVATARETSPSAEETKEPPAAAEETTAEPPAAEEEETKPPAAAESPPKKTNSRAAGSGLVVRFDISQSASSATIAQSAIESLKSVIPNPPSFPSTTPNLALALLNDASTTAQITTLLRQPSSGAGGDNLCRWLYDTFQSNNSDLKLVVLRFLPTLLHTYLSRVVSRRKSLAGFEAVLLSLYAHETNRRASQALTVNIPDLTHPSIYHESNSSIKNNATALNLALISPSLEAHNMVQSTKRARIVGVALELYYTHIHNIPESSKIQFCQFVRVWAGHDYPPTETETETAPEPEPEEEEEEGSIGRIPLPWEILQPVLRVLAHCLLGSNNLMANPVTTTPLFQAAIAAIRSLHLRSSHEINPKAILATRSLVSLGNMALEPGDRIDYTEIPVQTVINL